MNRIQKYMKHGKMLTTLSQANSASTILNSEEAHINSAGAHLNSAGAHLNIAGTHMNTAKTHMNSAGAHMNTAEAHMNSAGADTGSAGAHTGSAKRFFSKEFTAYKLLSSLFIRIWNIFYSTADNYLHYSNGILFGLVKEMPVFKKIFLFLCSAAYRVSGKRISNNLYDPGRQQFTYILRREPSNSFDGVIERYCGVPP